MNSWAVVNGMVGRSRAWKEKTDRLETRRSGKKTRGWTYGSRSMKVFRLHADAQQKTPTMEELLNN